ncbi:MAG TPA: hypothetical protein VL349_14810 [Terriglobales bacterium]|jgi:hypothetical protein|nr:hypothetical protein [Terriglobales bacterium]
MRKRTKTAIIPEPARSSALLRFLIVLTWLFSLLISVEPLHGRDASKTQRHAVIFGTVWGPDDRALPGVEVKIRPADSPGKKARWTLYSNRRGEFEVAVPAGKADYVIWAVTRNYKLPDGKHLQDSPELTVHIENDERADTGLHLK